MILQLEDIEKFIETRKIKQITSTKIYTGGKSAIDASGPFSEDIFGRMGDRKRKYTYGWIDLRSTVIHPEAFPIVCSIDASIAKMLANKEKYIINEDGTIEPDSLNGGSGVLFFVKNFDKFDFKKIAKEKRYASVDFIVNNKNKVLINKLIVMPAGIRDINMSEKSGKTSLQYSEISTLYTKLIRQTSSILGDVDSFPEEFLAPMIDRVQLTLREIFDWIKGRIKGKQGVIRGGMFKKITDYSGRMVITPDANLKMGHVGIPWQIVLKLHEPFTIYHILQNREYSKLIKEFISSNDISLDIADIKKFIKKTNLEPKSIPNEYKTEFMKLANDVVKDRVIIYKRDPAENRDSWISSYVRVDDTGYALKLNPFDLCKNGGD